MADVFVSYARMDQDFVRGLTQELESTGRDVWVDVQDIPLSAEWMAEIRSAIDGAEAFCFVLSPESAASTVCGEELAHAVASGKRIIPILHREVDPAVVPADVAARNWVWFREDDDRRAALAGLLSALDTDLEWLHDHTRLVVRAREWDGRGRSRSLTLRGDDLDRAEAALANSTGHEPSPTPLQIAYVAESRRVANRAQRLRLSAVAIALAVSLVLTAVAVVARNRAAHERDVARAQSLAAAARSELDTDPELSVMLSAEAYRRQPTIEAEEVLRESLSQSQVEQTLDQGEQPVVDVAYRGDGRAVTGTADGRVRVWDLRTGDAVAELDVGDDLAVLATSPDGRRLVTGGSDERAIVWELDSGRAVAAAAGHEGGVTAVAISPDGRLAATAAGSGDVSVWELATGDPVLDLTGHRSTVNGLAFDPLGQRLASAGDDQMVRIWDLDSGRSTAELHDPAGPVSSVAFTPAGSSVIEVGPFTAGFELAVAGGQAVSASPDSDPAADVAVGPDGRLVYLAGTDGVVRIWDRFTYPARVVGELRGLGRDLTAVAVSPDGRTVLTGGRDGLSRVFDPGDLGRYGTAAFRALLDGERGRVVTGDLDGVTRVWDRDTGLVIAELGEPLAPDDLENSIRDVALSPDGDLVAVAAGERVRIYDAASGTVTLDHRLTPFSGQRGAGPDERSARSASFTPDGRTLIVAHGDGTVGRLELTSENEEPLVTEPVPGGLLDVAVSTSAAEVLGAGADGSVRLWDANTGAERRRFEGHRGAVFSAQFDDEGDRIVTAGADATARVWDAATGRPLAVLAGHEGVVLRARFDASGAFVVTASLDGYARVFDAATGELVAQQTGDDLLGVTDAELRPDGTLLIAGGAARLVRCTACVTDDRLLGLAADRTTRQPTSDEQARYDL